MCRLDGVFLALSSWRSGFFIQIGFVRGFALQKLLARQGWSDAMRATPGEVLLPLYDQYVALCPTSCADATIRELVSGM